MGQRFTLSFSDIKMANIAYMCNDKCPEKMCENEGFVNAKCECQCPEFITGDLCQYVVSERSNKIYVVYCVTFQGLYINI